jgi:hypothetical protein
MPFNKLLSLVLSHTFPSLASFSRHFSLPSHHILMVLSPFPHIPTHILTALFPSLTSHSHILTGPSPSLVFPLTFLRHFRSHDVLGGIAFLFPYMLGVSLITWRGANPMRVGPLHSLQVVSNAPLVGGRRLALSRNLGTDAQRPPD